MEPRINLMANELGAKIAKRMHGVGQVIEQSPLPKTTRELVMLRVSQINGCGLCVDMHTKEATAAGESAIRLHLVSVWRESTVFSDAERAALALAEEGTRLADHHHGVSDETWAQIRQHYDDDQIVALIWVIAMINAANRGNVILRNRGGSYDPSMLAAMSH
ncbi:carboxymuconolactone decarboxylase family protein [Allorhizocola rhizosphaerae]|uniref:carboxymuconolactone decarboxylase family protein n=1 Tax=Allorhizocola rhizosphaerae TaxID=1872709 RepID=UPI000E3CC399|nr:carboxymuconolactone decarboxylase family protein [Allorhizocola rhizosphaerae]